MAHRVVPIDGRETAPAAFREDSFIDPATGQPIPFPERVTSGLGVGVPGTLATWQRALRRYGTRRDTVERAQNVAVRAGLRRRPAGLAVGAATQRQAEASDRTS